jgi:hypothetical protein
MASNARTRLQFDPGDMPIYAIGDIHGRLDLLQQAERSIIDNAARLPGRKLIVTLGDYIDRGPSSAQVISHLMAPPPPDFDRICLTGNHEIMMLDYIDGLISFGDWMQMRFCVPTASIRPSCRWFFRRQASSMPLSASRCRGRISIFCVRCRSWPTRPTFFSCMPASIHRGRS